MISAASNHRPAGSLKSRQRLHFMKAVIPHRPEIRACQRMSGDRKPDMKEGVITSGQVAPSFFQSYSLVPFVSQQVIQVLDSALKRLVLFSVKHDVELQDFPQ